MRSLALLLPLLGIVAAETFFKEEFGDDSWEKRWVQSKHKDDYGSFKVSAGKYYGDAKRDQGLKTSQDAKFYSLAAKFPKVRVFYRVVLRWNSP
ncbi:Calreticulin family protein [Cooperia oncophora]